MSQASQTMSDLEKKQDFIKGIKFVSETSNSFKHQNKEYMLFFTLGEEEESLVFTITDGLNYLWAKELDIADFTQMRKDLGLEGTFENFFQLFRDAILLLSGSFKIAISPENLDLNLIISYKISKSALLTGNVNIGVPMHFEQDKTMFRQFIRKTVFDLQHSKKKESSKLENEVFELKEKLRLAEEKIATMSKSMPTILEEPVLSQGHEQNESKKKKANTSLVNPNLKKRKGMGAKFGE